jgi:mannitol-specific phosphotransferase system IIBC component
MDISVVDAGARGLIYGAIFGIIGYTANRVWQIIRSPSEGARRFKIVGGITLLLLVGSMLVAMMGVVWAIAVGIAIAAITWVVKGFKSSNSSKDSDYNKPQAKAASSTEADATEFKEVKDAVQERKTVITCPNCGGKSRVVAGKYIDVTCPHCKTLFRTHT